MNQTTPAGSDDLGEALIGRMIAEAGDPAVEPRAEHASELRSLILSRIPPGSRTAQLEEAAGARIWGSGRPGGGGTSSRDLSACERVAGGCPGATGKTLGAFPDGWPGWERVQRGLVQLEARGDRGPPWVGD